MALNTASVSCITSTYHQVIIELIPAPSDITLATSPNHTAAIMEPTTETEVEIPQDLIKILSRAAVANGRTMEDEIIARLDASLDNNEVTDTNQRQH